MRFLVVALLLTASTAANAQSSACDVEEANVLPPVHVDVGMWQAAWNGFDYQLAAWRKLGETLDSRHPNLDAGSYAVQFTYTAAIFGWQAAHTVTVCLQKDENKTFEEAAEEKLDELAANSNVNGQYGSGSVDGSGGFFTESISGSNSYWDSGYHFGNHLSVGTSSGGSSWSCWGTETGVACENTGGNDYRVGLTP